MARRKKKEKERKSPSVCSALTTTQFALTVAISASVGMVIHAAFPHDHQASVTEPSKFAASASLPPESIPRTRSGAWGDILSHETFLVPTEDRIQTLKELEIDSLWRFPGMNLSEVTQVLQTLGLSAIQVDELTRRVHQDKIGVVLQPSDEFIVAMPSKARGNIYRHLGRNGANTELTSGWLLLEDWKSVWRNQFRISQTTIELADRLSFTHLSREWFGDLAVLLRLVPVDERALVAKAAATRSGLQVDARLNQKRDFLSYWRCDASIADLYELNDSGLDITYLLPPFPRQKLLTFAKPTQSANRPDCFWSASNFFYESPDNRFFEQQFFVKHLFERFERVKTPTYGDLILFAKPVGSDYEAVHAAIYLAAEIAFTKNGAAERNPWMLSEISEIQTEYSYLDSVRLSYWREKSRK